MRAAMGAPGRRPRSVSVDSHQVPRRRAGAGGAVARPAPSGHPRGRHGHAGVPHPLAVGREGVRGRSRRDLRSQGSGAGTRGRLAVVRAPRRARRPGAAVGRGARRGGVRAFQAGGVPRRRPADVPATRPKRWSLLDGRRRDRGTWQLARGRRGQSRGDDLAVHGALHDRAARGRQPVEVRHRGPRILLRAARLDAPRWCSPETRRPATAAGRSPPRREPMPGLPRTFFVTADRTP